MEKSNIFTKKFQWVCFIILLLSIALNVYLLTKENECKVVEKIKTEVIMDTIHDTIPKVIKEKVLYTRHDTLRVIDTIPGDMVHIIAEVPITQKEYSDDSTYTAWVSGYKQKLDSINVYRKTLYITKEVVKVRKQNFSVGPYVGYGYDFDSKKAGVSVGVGITYRLFGF